MFPVQDPLFAERIRDSFARQPVMQVFGATLESVAPGAVSVGLPFSQGLTQHHGFLHAGVVTTILDNACGFAALTLAPPGAGILTVEFKVNFMAPAKGQSFVASGRVLKAGRTLIVCQGEVLAYSAGSHPSPIAAILATMILRSPSVS